MAAMRRLIALLVVSLSSPLVAQQPAIPLWPNGNPEPSKVLGPEIDPTTDANRIVSGKVTIRVTNVSRPTLTVFPPPEGKNTGAAALVFPGGAYIRLAYNIEGTEVCEWLNSIGITRARAAEWHIDPARIGVIGFSAGAHLAVALSTHPGFAGRNVPPSAIDARPSFQMVIYPGWLNAGGKVDPSVAPSPQIPPTFLLQAENDYTAHVENALVYFQALKDAKIPAELHLFTEGGHGFGLRPTDLPISRWPQLAETWLHTIHVLGAPGPVGRP
jgi:hypothetical protein